MTESSNSGAGENAAAAEPIEGTVMTPEQLAALAAIAGNIKVSITLASGTTYNLAASVPTAATDPYTFKLEEVAGSTTQTLADFKVVDSTNFSVTVNLPTITAGGTKINGGFNLVATPPSPEQGQIEA